MSNIDKSEKLSKLLNEGKLSEYKYFDLKLPEKTNDESQTSKY